jgi:hypothetical protein
MSFRVLPALFALQLFGVSAYCNTSVGTLDSNEITQIKKWSNLARCSPLDQSIKQGLGTTYSKFNRLADHINRLYATQLNRLLAGKMPSNGDLQAEALAQKASIALDRLSVTLRQSAYDDTTTVQSSIETCEARISIARAMTAPLANDVQTGKGSATWYVAQANENWTGNAGLDQVVLEDYVAYSFTHLAMAMIRSARYPKNAYGSTLIERYIAFFEFELAQISEEQIPVEPSDLVQMQEILALIQSIAK